MRNKLNQVIVAAVGAGTLAGLSTSLYAQSSDALLDKLVDKGVLTVKEANELKEEADKGFTSAYQVKSGLPDWVTSMKIGGDLRGRYELFSADDSTFIDRHRFRYRLRPGIVATLKDDFEVGFRLTSSEATGNFGGDPISGNSTFQDNGSKKFIYIDLAYAKWTPINNSLWSGTFTVGKMENPFSFSDMVFDGDYTPEGLAQQFSFNAAENQVVRLNLGQFAVDEISSSNQDPYLFGAQVKLDSTWNKELSTSLGFGALALTSEQRLTETAAGSSTRVAVVNAAGVPTGGTATIPGAAASSSVPNVNRGNSRSGGVLANNFNPLIADGSVTYTLESFPMYKGAFPIRIGAEYMVNPAADHKNEGYAFGVTFGKSGKKGLWDLSYRWKHLEADAWWEEVVDSDFGGLYPAVGSSRASYGSGTNVEGHIFKASYSPFDSWTIGVTYFLAHAISGTGDFDDDVGRLQLDAVWKF